MKAFECSAKHYLRRDALFVMPQFSKGWSLTRSVFFISCLDTSTLATGFQWISGLLQRYAESQGVVSDGGLKCAVALALSMTLPR